MPQPSFVSLFMYVILLTGVQLKNNDKTTSNIKRKKELDLFINNFLQR